MKVTNEDLFKEIVKCRVRGSTGKLFKMLFDLATEYVNYKSTSKQAGFSGYKPEIKNELVAHAIWILARTWHGFDPEKNTNPRAFMKTTIHGAFTNRLATIRRECQEQADNKCYEHAMDLLKRNK